MLPDSRGKLPYAVSAVIFALLIAQGCGQRANSTVITLPKEADITQSLKKAATPAEKIVLRARLEAVRQVRYDASYTQLSYPNGDVPDDRGACSDVIVRALRAAGYDLQTLINQDKKAHPDKYPTIGATRASDSNIDHRRALNHIAYFDRHAQRLTESLAPSHLAQWQPGDLVYVDLGGGILHCGVVSDNKDSAGRPFLLHNIGPAASEEDVLDRWRIVRHFRFPSPPGKS
jgi:uncharacterized protein